ncbi:hypothetical protein D3C75_1160100 [compost metagenome]
MVRGQEINEGLVDFQCGNGQMGQVAQGRVARSEVIQGNSHQSVPQGGQLRQNMIIRLQQHCLRQLQLKITGRQPSGRQRVQHQLIKLRLQQLGHGNIH